MQQITFINALTVPAEREAEFLQKWERGAAYVRACNGFVSTSLHRSLTPRSQFQFFTIAVWESAQQFHDAVASDWWQQYVSGFGFGDGATDFQAAPHVCELVR